MITTLETSKLTITIGTMIKGYETYHMDGTRKFDREFRVLGRTKNDRFRVHIIQEVTDGNDSSKTITIEEKKTITLDKMLVMQNDFVRYCTECRVVKIND